MDWSKYNSIPTEFKTAREIGMAPATLGAMARRGFVEVLDTSPKMYRRISSAGAKVYELYEQHKTDYFVLYKHNAPIGMLCSMSNGSVVNCYGGPYDLTGVTKIRFDKNTEFNLEG